MKEETKMYVLIYTEETLASLDSGRDRYGNVKFTHVQRGNCEYVVGKASKDRTKETELFRGSIDECRSFIKSNNLKMRP